MLKDICFAAWHVTDHQFDWGDRMRTRIGLATLLAGASVSAVILVSAVMPVSGQNQGTTAPRTSDGKPDFTGIWQAMNSANWDLQAHEARRGPVIALGAAFSIPAGPGVVEGNEIPYLPAAAAKKKENAENWLTRDPEIKCFMPGVPRMTYMPYPFQIIQSTNKIQMAYEFSNAARTIHLDKVEGPPDDTWMGHSAGRWEGDTLVVEVTNFNDKTWFDRAGNFHSDALHLVERFTPISADAIRYEVTIDDPKVFTRPWTIAMPIYRRLEPNIQLLDYQCIDFAEEFLYGNLRKQQLVKHWEGDTIVVDIKRKVPPGDHLYEWYGK